MTGAEPGALGPAAAGDEVERYLALLRAGGSAERIAARTSLAAIFERRGLLAEAAECYAGNIRDGVRDPAQCERLAALYRRLSDGMVDERRTELPVHFVATAPDASQDRPRPSPVDAATHGHGAVQGDAVASAGEAVPPAPPRALDRLRSLLDRESLAHPLIAPAIYLAMIALAEIAITVEVRWGLPLHVGIMLFLLVHGAATPDDRRRALYWGMVLAPVIRISSLTLPLNGIPFMFWYAVVSVPVFAGTIAAARTLDYSRRDLGLVISRRSLPLDLLMLPVGGVIGLAEYLILLPEPLTRGGSPSEIWLPALILAVCTGLEEELIFRGLLHKAAIDLLGVPTALIFVSLLFAALHIGYQSVTDLTLVFGVGWLFASIAQRTGSILGPTLAHAGVNVSMFLFWPFVLPTLLGLG